MIRWREAAEFLRSELSATNRKNKEIVIWRSCARTCGLSFERSASKSNNGYVHSSKRRRLILTQMSLTHKAVPPLRRAKVSNSKNDESDNPIAPSFAFPSSTGARSTLSGKSVKGCKSNDFIFEGRTAKRRPRRRRLCYISTAVAKSTNLV